LNSPIVTFVLPMSIARSMAGSYAEPPGRLPGAGPYNGFPQVPEGAPPGSVGGEGPDGGELCAST
jgi:hypothetical protein